MKDFLYLVQARARLAEKHLSLASDRADVLIYTFDKKINKPNFLYKRNTSWPEGRNILIEAARKSNKKYKYYILLDDDIAFTKGSFKEFEDEVLSVNPVISVPVYVPSRTMRYLSNLSPFRYSCVTHFDCCFVCVTKELLFADKLFPYDMELDGVSHRENYYCSWKFWFDVFEDYSGGKLMALNKIHIKNMLSENNYVELPCSYHDLLAQLPNGRKSKLEKTVPHVFLWDRRREVKKKLYKLREKISGSSGGGGVPQ